MRRSLPRYVLGSKTEQSFHSDFLLIIAMKKPIQNFVPYFAKNSRKRLIKVEPCRFLFDRSSRPHRAAPHCGAVSWSSPDEMVFRPRSGLLEEFPKLEAKSTLASLGSFVRRISPRPNLLKYPPACRNPDFRRALSDRGRIKECCPSLRARFRFRPFFGFFEFIPAANNARSRKKLVFRAKTLSFRH